MRKVSFFLIGLALSLSLVLLAVEIFAQIYYYVVLHSKIENDIKQGLGYFIFQKSDNENIGYELIPGLEVNSNGLLLKTNALGLRESNDSTYAKRQRIGLIGDSVVFGFQQTQDSTLSAMTQLELDAAGYPSKIFNVGTPGYSSWQVKHKLEEFQGKLDFDEVFYILNPNDFSVMNTVYEGGDNGTNRYFNPPMIKTPWFVRKLVYRYYRNADAHLYNERWYRWIFEGTKEMVFQDLKDMQAMARQKGFHLTVIPLPSGFAYQNGKYVLADMHGGIIDFLQKNSIHYINLLQSYPADDPKAYFDVTDHLTYRGNHVLVNALMADYASRQRQIVQPTLE
jgi:hypothetical protein